MALVYEDGSGVAGANSYVLYSQYIEYFDCINDEKALAFTQEEVEGALVLFSRHLDHYDDWREAKLTCHQGLAFPRCILCDCEGCPIPNGIPREIPEAVMLGARAKLCGEDLTGTTTTVIDSELQLAGESFCGYSFDYCCNDSSDTSAVNVMKRIQKLLRCYTRPVRMCRA